MFYRSLKLLVISLLGIFLLIGNSAYAATNSKKTTAHKAKSVKHKHSRIKAKPHSSDYMEGVASCYAPKFVGRKTSSGDRFVMDKFTGASPTLPMRTKVKVTNLKNQKIVYVEINDRMAFSSGHVIDFPKLSGSWIGLNCPVGMTQVKLEIVDDATFNDALKAQLAGAKLYDNESGIYISETMGDVAESNASVNEKESQESSGKSFSKIEESESN